MKIFFHRDSSKQAIIWLLWNFIPEETTSRDHTIIFFLVAELDVSNLMNLRRRVFWRKPSEPSYGAYWYYIELLSKHEHGVWFNNCPWLLEHMWIRNTASWVTTHNLSCEHRPIMEFNMTTRMNNPKKHGF